MLLTAIIALAALTSARFNPLQSVLAPKYDTCPPDTPCTADGKLPIQDPLLETFCVGKEDGNHPHPYSCTHYIGCLGQIEAYLHICATGKDGCLLHYVQNSGPVPEDSYCDYAPQANCEASIKCSEKHLNAEKEGYELVEDDSDQDKQEHTVADCDPETPCTEDGELPFPDPVLEGFCTDRINGNYPHPYSCTHYIACVAQTHAYMMECAKNHNGCLLHYVADSGPDPTTSRCDYPEVAGCSVDTCPTISDTLSEEMTNVIASSVNEKEALLTEGCEPDTPCTADGKLPNPDPALNGFCIGKEDGSYPHPYSCTYWITCLGRSEGYAIPCELSNAGCSLYYVADSGPDLSKSYCDYPEKANCHLSECPETYHNIPNKADENVFRNAGPSALKGDAEL